MSFASKRKPRIIQTFEDDNPDQASGSSDKSKDASSQDAPSIPLKFGKRPLKSSSLRRSINVNDDQDTESGGTPTPAPSTTKNGDDGDGPVVVRPMLGRSGSTKLKKRASSSRLSFGPSAEAPADDGDGGAALSTPKKSSLGQKAVENSAFKKSISRQRLPIRDADEDRPRYSKEYLDELQSSTPNTPQNLASLRIADEDEMDLDPSELEGAMVVESTELAPANAAGSSAPHILTEAEIREKKERRARLAREQDYMPLDGSDDEANRSYISLLPGKKKDETRLVREDEDLGEGFDEFVEDEGLSLGRKAEREARKRRKAEMAELINAAEDGEDQDSDDSEAERRAAYEAAQTRAGMDGLTKAAAQNGDGDGLGSTGPVMIPKMKPLPELADCLARMQSIVQGLEDEVTKKRKKMAELEREKQEILDREKEVQDILDKAGQKYQSVMGSADAVKLATQSPLRAIPPGLAGDIPVERGLESLGTTPTKRPEVDEL
ncbi:uncharacterized protein E0L32_000384 [Thyridium curvatum]|uniref:Nineteen complex-related protein 2-domain-containing protein n=1 Tax=Thyridium curvatum TaxID=1093900 RepID=A0A507BHM3_9PEZI|nr:uncharacterized protein E0L32_000384 [Thyridium curvatum]TPX16050.1 hypothetical protein E0L32_000384 [Thyridium curvatum]